MFNFFAEEVAAVGAIVTDVVYYAIAVALVVAVGQVLSRSGRAFLGAAPGGGPDGPARAASRLLVVTFYLLSMGFVVLTAPSWTRVAGVGQALGLLTGKVGVLLLVLGALHVTSTVVFARLRRGRAWPGAGGTGGTGGTGASGGPVPPGPGSAAPARASGPGPGPGDAGAAAPALWRAGRVVH
jgi:hypothetical protein